MTDHTTTGNSERPFSEITKREWFAAHAPLEIPDWFRHEKEDSPKEPLSWINFGPSYPPDVKEACINWHQDPCFDLPNEIAWYQVSWEDYHESQHEWRLRDSANRFKQWRYHYADLMLSDKPIQENKE